MASLRLRWRIRPGPIWENIHVLDDPCDPDSPQRPFQEESGRMHEIAAEPVPKAVYNRIFVTIATGSRPWQFRDRPRRSELPKLEVHLEQGQTSYTLGEFVLRVHPWLVSLREEILEDIRLSLIAYSDSNSDAGSVEFEPSSKDADADAKPELWVDPVQITPVSVHSSDNPFVSLDLLWESTAETAQRLQAQLQEEEVWRTEQAERDKRLPSLAFLRLRWEVRQGNIQNQIHVIRDVNDPYSEQEPFLSESGALHEIADLPLTMTPMPELRVGLAMEKPEDVDSSSERSDPEDASTGPKESTPEGLTAEMTITSGDGRDYVSIKDFVFAAHDWLVSWRSTILQRNGRHAGSMHIGNPWPEDAQLWLDPLHIESIGFFQDQTQSMHDQWTIVSAIGPHERHPEVLPQEYVPVYPTEILPDSHYAQRGEVWPSLAFLRLRWMIPAPDLSLTLDQSISVMDDVYDPKSTQMPFRDGSSGDWHEVAALPFSRPPCKEIHLEIDYLDGLESWKLYTEEDSDSEAGSEAGSKAGSKSAPKLTVTAGPDHDFITVGDYIAQVHPWLVSLRPQICIEAGMNTYSQEWAEQTDIYVDTTSPGLVQFYTDVEGEKALEGEWQGPAMIASKG